ncbi:MAG: dihydrofolate reductase [Nocardioidaceae bacterium]|nr:dihydrofolate reductase [Nocardioidaceae bacterium]
MTTTYYTATTLDGFIADEHDSLDWLFKQDVDQEGAMNYTSFYADVGAVVMGRTTYEWVRDQLEVSGEGWAYDVPTWVMTHAELTPIDGADIRFARDDVAAVHAAMTEAAPGKNLWVAGGGDLAAQFAEAGLLDEVVVSIAPVTLGAGRPLFPRRFDLELLEVERNRAFVCARYSVVAPE